MKSSRSSNRLLSSLIAESSVQRRSVARHRAPGQTDSPEVDRLREHLVSGDRYAAARAARSLLNLLEPDSLADAQASVIDDDGSAAARHALQEAWETYRHDRHRGSE